MCCLLGLLIYHFPRTSYLLYFPFATKSRRDVHISYFQRGKKTHPEKRNFSREMIQKIDKRKCSKRKYLKRRKNSSFQCDIKQPGKRNNYDSNLRRLKYIIQIAISIKYEYIWIPIYIERHAIVDRQSRAYLFQLLHQPKNLSRNDNCGPLLTFLQNPNFLTIDSAFS